MELQKIFKQEYADKLYNDIYAKDVNILKGNLMKYNNEIFDYDSTQTMYIAGVYKPEGLLEALLADIDDDYKCAIHLYEAYEALQPIQAADKAFWIFLSHVDLYPYVQQKFGDIMDLSKDDNLRKKQNSIGIHWFFKREVVRNALAGLWWDVKCTVRDSSNNAEKYKFTKVLFDHYDLRMINFANYALFRNKNQVVAILDYFMNHPEMTQTNFKIRSRFITKYFNMLGGSKQLAYLPVSYFTYILNNIYPDVMKLDKNGLVDEDFDGMD